MVEMVYERARREAAALLREHWDGTFPVRLAGITAALDATKYETDLGPALSGMVTKEPFQGARIALNSTHVAGRRRFTWAHEIGHIVERAAVAKDDDYAFTDKRGQKYDLHEFFADEFAGSLLMPAAEFKRRDAENLTDSQLATLFEVSIDAVVRRRARLAKHPDRSGMMSPWGRTTQ